jgi:1-acyl-sn-glycerol-3-phosphate acyltransferase
MNKPFLRSLIQTLIGLLTRTTYLQTEYLPPSGGIILATNHNSRVDSALLLSNPVRQDISALVAKEYRDNLFFRFIVQAADVIWLDRSKADFSAFRIAVEKIKEGRVLGIAPEGTRSRIGQLLEGKPGIQLLTSRADVPIVPVGITGSEDMMQKLRAFKRPETVVRFGKPFTLPPLPRDNREEAMQKNTTEVMCQIAALLPERYRGFYKDFPRVQEIIKENGYTGLE